MKSLRQYTINTSFGKIHTLEQGSGAPMIFFHGWSIDGWSCVNILHTFSRHYRVIVPTMPGAYPSFSWKMKIQREHMAQALLEWYQNLHAPHCIVVGHSLGGVLSVLLAEHIANSVTHLILIDTVGVPFKRSKSAWASEWFKKRRDTYREHKTNVIRILDRGLTKNVLFRTNNLIELSQFAQTVDIREIISRIDTKLTIIWGDRDVFIPIEVGRALHERLPSSTFRTVRGNHDWPLFQPELLNNVL